MLQFHMTTLNNTPASMLENYQWYTFSKCGLMSVTNSDAKNFLPLQVGMKMNLGGDGWRWRQISVPVQLSSQ